MQRQRSRFSLLMMGEFDFSLGLDDSTRGRRNS
jgi:hypothetical protein